MFKIVTLCITMAMLSQQFVSAAPQFGFGGFGQQQSASNAQASSQTFNTQQQGGFGGLGGGFGGQQSVSSAQSSASSNSLGQQQGYGIPIGGYHVPVGPVGHHGLVGPVGHHGPVGHAPIGFGK